MTNKEIRKIIDENGVSDAVQSWYYDDTELNEKNERVKKKESSSPIDMFVQGFGYAQNYFKENPSKLNE